MSLQTVISDVRSWSGEIGELLELLAGKSAATQSNSATSPSLGVAVGVDPLPELTAGLTALSSVSNLFRQWDAEMNTPAMVNASVAQKLQAFRDRVNQDLAQGNEADLEKLEAL